MSYASLLVYLSDSLPACVFVCLVWFAVSLVRMPFHFMQALVHCLAWLRLALVRLSRVQLRSTCQPALAGLSAGNH